MKNAVESAGGDQARRVLWSRRIEQWRRSGQTQREFCEEHSIALSTFRWWRARLDAGHESTREARSLFVPLTISNGPLGATGTIEVELRSGTRLRFAGEAARVAVDRLVEKVR